MLDSYRCGVIQGCMCGYGVLCVFVGWGEWIVHPANSCSLLPRVASGIDGVDVVVANVSDQASLETMCASTSVLINCVGPVSEVQMCGFMPMVPTLKWVSLYEH